MQGRRVCLGFIPKFTFDTSKQQCVPFVYGGCGGSENLFDTKMECLQKCDRDYNDDTPKRIDVCGLDIVTGPCRMSKPYFGFNKEHKRCEKFFYGGKT